MNHVTADETPPRRTGPERTCVGCRAHDARDALVRFAFDGERLILDPRARLGGRGVWVHGTRGCVEKAVRGGGFARVLRARVPFSVADVVTMLRADAESRVAALLTSARRARLVVTGTDPCLGVLVEGTGCLAIVAGDAGSSKETVGEAAHRAGKPVLELGDKASLGRVFGKEETGAVVVTDPGLASSISRVATRIAALSEGE